MRLFVGIDIFPAIRDSIAAYVSRLQKEESSVRAKWVKPESLHVTLKFIGETDKASEIEKALRTVQSSPLVLAFRGVGFFTPKSPRVFWAGVECGPELGTLAADIERTLQPVGIPKEPHTYEEFQPHLTLARSGAAARGSRKPSMFALRDLVLGQPQPDFGTMTAEEFILFRSETLPGGSRYTPLAKFPMRLG